MNATETTRESAPRGPRLGALQWVLLGVSGLLMAAGVGLGIAGTLAEPPAVGAAAPAQGPAAGGGDGPRGSDMASGLVGGGGALVGGGGALDTGGGAGGGVTWPFPIPGLPGGQPQGQPDGQPAPDQGQEVPPVGAPPVADPWSPAIFRMGFGFFVGFAMAYALRSFVKVTVVSAGVFFLLMFGLQYAGLVQVQWSAMAERYDTLQDWLLAQVGGFRAFVTGYLPAAGATLAGLGLGFLRK